MKKSCKHIDIKKTDTIKPFVTNCCYRHYIDMMGYVIHSDGSVSIRGRNFIHLRRMALRHNKPFTISQARRILSYKGFTEHSDSASVVQKYKLNDCYKDASITVSDYDRRHNNADY